MPYKSNGDLPGNLKKLLPAAAQSMYREVFNSVLGSGKSESVAAASAWATVKKRFKKKEDKWVADSDSFEIPTLYTFETRSCESKVVMNGETEEIVLEAVLANTDLNAHGKFFDEDDLKELDSQINTMGSTLPDVDHEVLLQAIKKHGNNYDAVVNEVRQSKGVFKSIRSAIKDGQLWIQAFLDKRYKNHVQKFNALSIEALADADISTGRLKKPRYLGFTFTNNPSIKTIPRFAA